MLNFITPKKNKQPKLPLPSFTISPGKIQSYSIDTLRDLLSQSYSYTGKLQQTFKSVTAIHNELIQTNQTAEQIKAEILQRNENLNKIITANEYKEDFVYIFKKSLTSVLEEFGINGFKGALAADAKIKNRLKEFDKAVKKNIKANNKNTSLEESQELLIKTAKSVSFNLESVRSDYRSLLAALQDMYHKLARKENESLLKKLALSELQIVSRAKLDSNSHALAQLRKENSRVNAEVKVLNKTNKKLLNENSKLRQNNDELNFSMYKMEGKMNSLNDARSTNESEMSGHMNLIKMVQEENRGVVTKLKKMEEEKKNFDSVINSLKATIQKNKDIYEQDRGKIVGVIRKEQIKVENLRSNLTTIESKNIKLEKILKDENKRYEQLYMKYKKTKADKKRLAKRKTPDTSSNDNSYLFVAKGNGNIHKSFNSLRKKSKPVIDNPTKIARELNFVAKNNASTQNTTPSKPSLDVEDLKLQLMTTEVQLETERNIFSTILTEKRENVKNLEKRIFEQERKIHLLQSHKENAKEELFKLSSLVEEMSENSRVNSSSNIRFDSNTSLEFNDGFYSNRGTLTEKKGKLNYRKGLGLVNKKSICKGKRDIQESSSNHCRWSMGQ